MIFKYCVWPDAAKDETNKVLTTTTTPTTPVILKPLSARKFADNLLGCCPCAFRCRKPIDIGPENGLVNGIVVRDEQSEATPVFALRLDGSVDTIDKEPALSNETDSNQAGSSSQTHSAGGRSTNHSDREPSPHNGIDGASGPPAAIEESRSNSGSSSSSNRSARTRRRSSGTPSGNSNRQQQTILPGTVIDDNEINEEEEKRSIDRLALEDNTELRISSAGVRSQDDKAFDVISVKSHTSRRNTPDAISTHTDPQANQDHPTSSSDEPTIPTPIINDRPALSPSSESISDRQSIDSIDGLANNRQSFSRSKSALSIEKTNSSAESQNSSQRRMSKYSLESLIDDGRRNGYYDVERSTSKNSNERIYSARSGTSAKSVAEMNGNNNESEVSESADEDDVDFDTVDYQNPREIQSGTSLVVSSPVRSRMSYEYETEVRNSESNVTIYSYNSIAMSPNPKIASPKRFINNDSTSKDASDTSEETPPLPIGFDADENAESSDETDDVSLKPQISRMATPIDLPRRLLKVSPCKMRPRANCHRATSVPASRHVEKTSKAVQQCFTQLESKEWEITLKGLRALSKIAKEEPEQLDVCAPGVVARMLGKHVKNLRSQVARVACSAAGDIFAAHVRGIEQDLDEIAGPLLHRTADTNRFLREDCNVALDCMIEHFPPQRTIMTVANRGGGHQNTVVHATTARLLYVIVTDMGPDHVMILPRDVRDKLFLTTAKLLTDGNLQARKHAKEIFRILSRCEGFRKALTDAVPETTLRLIDKTLRSL